MQDFLIAIIVSWILFRLFRPITFVHWNNFPRAGREDNSYPHQSSEGGIKITQPQNQNKADTNQTGEYVDYEEIK